MYLSALLPPFLALANITWTVSRAAPLPVRVVEDQTRAQQVPLSPPLPPPATTSTSNSSRPLDFVLPDWVTGPYPNSLKDEDRDVFNTTIEGITLAQRHSKLGNNNAGVYAVASFDSAFAQLFPPSIAVQDIDPSRLLVKILKEVDEDMIAEVKALKIVGQFVASGMLKLPIAKSNEKRKRDLAAGRTQNGKMVVDEDLYQLKPVIIMLKMAGTPLTSTPGYIAEKNPETKRHMMGDTLNMMCDRVGKLALEHRFVHRDNIIGNVLVIAEGTQIIDVNIIDWGGKFLSSIRDDVTMDDLMAWCHNRWAVYVWESSL